eukprot:CAMPEP_0113634324 /NCGR_PEP_ID=MMETSP0017_2-20120614/17869_1 /TAXON_ID=2856 /ORGANISM="Cylindrotheca closterium" /LENGTH=35 /DNA_ID=CAMNT_0000545011 /DNA_START=133 /DNA_END=236 /DNA_ORIENTATION=+ /assembly_acc=CAM_ASM_000147
MAVEAPNRASMASPSSKSTFSMAPPAVFATLFKSS